MRLLAVLSGPLRADPVRCWLGRLGWDAGASPYAAADLLAAGAPLSASLCPPGGQPRIVAFSPGRDTLAVDLGDQVDADWLCAVASDAGRMLPATAVVVTGDPRAQLPGVLDAARASGVLPEGLWLAPVEAGRYDLARATASRAHRQWDGALLLRT